MSLEAKRPPETQPGSPLANVVAEIEKAFLGKRHVVELSVATLLAGGHLLLEDVPGTGKTTLAKAISRVLDCRFSRIQFTADMLPSDVVGTSIYNPKDGQFAFRAGPIFTNILLADEVNRTSPRTQSSLLEAMNERQVTVDTGTMELESPFFVIATQNPKELHGTYPLPESQLDRFLLSIDIGYPEAAVEKQILAGGNDSARLASVRRVLSKPDLLDLQRRVEQVAAKDSLIDYAYAIVSATRSSPHFELGASPRAGIQLIRAARAVALMRGRSYVTPDDVRRVAPHALAHRLLLKSSSQVFAGRSQAIAKIEELLDSIPAP
jgi:MoxR-like ATPase